MDWLLKIQNPDGGWGEDDSGYELDYKSYKTSASTPSQTSWAVIGLMAAGEVDHSECQTRHCLSRKPPGRRRVVGRGTLHGHRFFRGVFYLRYVGYAKFFPLWALARYRNLKAGNTATVLHGM